MNNLKTGELTARSSAGGEDSNGNFTFFRQDSEPRVGSINSSGNLNGLQFSGSLQTDIGDEIAQNARLFLQDGKSEVKLQLNPPELGGLKLEFSIVDEVLETKISVEKPLVKEMIDKDIPRIRELLSSADVDVGRLDVALQENEDEGQEFLNNSFLPDTEDRGKRSVAYGEREQIDEEGNEEIQETVSVNSGRINYLV
jgi:flagellar hook-length control protein FliK